MNSLPRRSATANDYLEAAQVFKEEGKKEKRNETQRRYRKRKREKEEEKKESIAKLKRENEELRDQVDRLALLVLIFVLQLYLCH